MFNVLDENERLLVAASLSAFNRETLAHNLSNFIVVRRGKAADLFSLPLKIGSFLANGLFKRLR